jgi:NAD(P)-dependent dehydrogenase (short-subunit alcohol dehydrogenase family)
MENPGYPRHRDVTQTMETQRKTAIATGSARGIGTAVAAEAVLDFNEGACKIVANEISLNVGNALRTRATSRTSSPWSTLSPT